MCFRQRTCNKWFGRGTLETSPFGLFALFTLNKYRSQYRISYHRLTHTSRFLCIVTVLFQEMWFDMLCRFDNILVDNVSKLRFVANMWPACLQLKCTGSKEVMKNAKKSLDLSDLGHPCVIMVPQHTPRLSLNRSHTVVQSISNFVKSYWPLLFQQQSLENTTHYAP